MVRKLSLLIIGVIAFVFANGQQAAAVDSIKLAIKDAKTIEEKVYWMDALSRIMMNVNLKSADSVGSSLIAVAEESRDRRLMITAYMSNGTRCSYFAGSQDYTKRSIEFFNKALEIARQNKIDTMTGSALLKLAGVHLSIPDKDKALNYANQAAAIISNVVNDSLKAEVQNTYGNVYLARNDKILSLRHYMNGLRIAEETKPVNHSLLRSSYIYLSNFYSGIEDYDKALDYLMLAFKKLDHIKEKFVPYQRAIDLSAIGQLYSAKKNYDIALDYFKRSLEVAEQMKFSTLRVPAYINIIEQYMRMDQPQKALDYFNSEEGRSLKKYMNDFGFGSNMDMLYGNIYSRLNQFDSARYYYDKAASFYQKESNPVRSMYFFSSQAGFYKRTGENQKAIDLYLKVKEIADKTGQLESAERAAKNLDTLYGRTGNYQQASFYNASYYQYKDSIEALNKEKELAQIEAADEQQRQERLAKEAEEKKRQRNNIQYFAITIGIVALFIALVVLGMFKVSATTIKMIGFFAFIMFFEFIFLIFKKNIYAITKGEPLKDLLFMIGLAALLLPLHHWLEEKVIHYLTSHNRLTSAGHHLRNRLFKKKSEEIQKTKHRDH